MPPPPPPPTTTATAAASSDHSAAAVTKAPRWAPDRSPESLLGTLGAPEPPDGEAAQQRPRGAEAGDGAVQAGAAIHGELR